MPIDYNKDIIILTVAKFVFICCFSLELALHHLNIYYLLGFPILSIEWQKMENPDLRSAMGMKLDQKGVRIRRIDPTAPESQVLKPSDIILSFDGVDIANDGTGMWFFCV